MQKMSLADDTHSIRLAAAASASSSRAAVWPQVSCSTEGCDFQDRWNRMRSKKVWQHFQESVDQPLDDWSWHYTCKRCIGKELGLEHEEEAMAAIAEANGTWQHKKARCERFTRSQAEIKESFAMLGVVKSKREIHQISRSFMCELFAELSEFMVLKIRQLELVNIKNQEHQKYIDELKDCREPARVKELVELIEANCQKDIPQLSFQGRPEMLYASAYADQMTACKGGHYRYYFVCIGKDGAQVYCMSMFASKEWLRLHDTEAWTAGQRWYCRCGTKYKAGTGVIVEVMRGPSLYYMRAKCPDAETLDVRAMKHERDFGGHLTAAALYARLPVLRPSTSELVSAVDLKTGHFRFKSYEDFMALPMMQWDDIFQFVRTA